MGTKQGESLTMENDSSDGSSMERALQELLRKLRDKATSKSGDGKSQVKAVIKEFIEGRDF